MIQAHIHQRFRGYLPIVIDIETGGFNAETDAILEIAAVILHYNEQNMLACKKTLAFHVEPFKGANLDAKAMAFTGIVPDHPFRFAKSEREVFNALFKEIRTEIKASQCQRAIMVAHNANFDLSFINAAIIRNNIKRNPFHPFSTIDTASLSAIFLGQTVLARACETAKLTFDKNEAHSALYDAEKTAELFCCLTNQWQKHNGWDIINQAPNLVE
ncbi:MAG: ribonuclease T [Legionellales bacterium]|nr:ribonuclease T [Legionellales bacterium]|tara:strand:- start:5 stop:649 length:645 start_codon:yes stop_codon:yes gene_type:complete